MGSGYKAIGACGDIRGYGYIMGSGYKAIGACGDIRHLLAYTNVWAYRREEMGPPRAAPTYWHIPMYGHIGGRRWGPQGQPPPIGIYPCMDIEEGPPRAAPTYWHIPMYGHIGGRRWGPQGQPPPIGIYPCMGI
jgi:hypothetical protein